MSDLQSTPNRHDPLTGEVRAVFVRYSYPEVLAFVTTSSAGFVDAIFLGNYVGPAALAAVNLSMPVWALIMGLGMLASVGGSVVAGKRMGAGDRSGADAIFTVTFLITVGASIVISAFALLFLDSLVAALGATEEELADLLHTYLWILLWLTPPWMLQLVLFYFVRLDGKPRLASAVFIVGGLINIAFDYLLSSEWVWGLQVRLTQPACRSCCQVLFSWVIS